MVLMTVTNSYREIILKPSVESAIRSRNAEFVVIFENKVAALN